jgi:hypothetical protein
MRITISIPKPCHEDWQAMTPDAVSTAGKGRHCAQCDHVVADLTRATDAQLVALRHAGALPLAAFTSLVAVAAGQQAIAQGGPVVRPVVTQGEPSITRPAVPPPMLVGKMIAVPHSIPAHCTSPITGDTIVTPAQDPILERMEHGNVSIRTSPPINSSSFGGMEITFVPDTATVEVCGTVVDDRSGEPIAFADVWSMDLNAHATTDASGTFRFRLPFSPDALPVTIEIRSPGYLFEKHSFEPIAPALPTPSSDPSGVALTGAVDPVDPMGITGSVVNKTTGERVPGLVVRVRGTAVAVQCDAKGEFFLSVPELLVGKPVTLDLFQGEHLLKSIPLSPHAIPCCVPVSLAPEEMPAVTAPASECQDVGTIRLQERRMMMGDMRVSVEPSRPDTLDRIMRPVKNALRKLSP